MIVMTGSIRFRRNEAIERVPVTVRVTPLSDRQFSCDLTTELGGKSYDARFNIPMAQGNEDARQVQHQAMTEGFRNAVATWGGPWSEVTEARIFITRSGS